MKYRVLSIRMPVALLTYCYDILKLGGLTPEKMPLSTAVVTTVERISASLIAEGRIHICQDDTDAEQRLMQFIAPKAWAGEASFKDAVPASLETHGPIQQTDYPQTEEDRKAKINRLLEDAVAKTLAEDGEDLAKIVTAPQHDKFIPEAEPVALKPLAEMDMLPEAECITDKMYASAEDENMKLAIRIIYKALPMNMRSTEAAYKLAYKVWAEREEAE